MTKTKLITYGLALAILFCSLPSAPTHGQGETPQTPNSTDALGITVGISQPPTLNYGTEMVAVNRLVGKTQGVVMYFSDFTLAYGPLLQDQFDRQMPVDQRPISMITLVPAKGRKALGCDQDYADSIPINNILNGACDTFIRNYARGMKARGQRFLLKFASEMNLSVWPWSPLYQNLPISKFVDMWRYVHNLFQQEGATNVEFVWDVNYDSYPNTPANDPNLYYPGDAYVDWVAMHGYNYVNLQPGVPYYYQTFEQIFDKRLKEFACKYKKPQIIGETGSVEDNTGQHSKVEWIADAYQKIPNYPFLRLVIWLNDRDNITPQADFRVTSGTTRDGGVSALPTGSGAWTTAYKNAIAPAIYTNILPTVAEATPPTTYCGTGQPAPTLTLKPESVFLQPGESSTLDLTSLFFSTSPLITFEAPTGITVVASPRSAPSPWGTVKLTVRTTTGLADGIYTVKITAGSATQTLTVFSGDLQQIFLPLAVK